nr:YheC/YheD family protein [Mesobacillus maritimus]
MKKTFPLKQDSFLSHHVPELHWFSTKSLKRMVESYPQIYVKPNRGRKGIGISRVKQLSESEYELSYGNTNKRVSYPELVKELNRRFVPGKSYLVQQGIDLATVNGCPFHIRVVMQKPMDIWRLTVTSAIVAKRKDAVVTNVARGNTEFPMVQVLKNCDQKLNPMNMIREIVDLSHQIVNVLGARFPFLVVGLDLGIDKQGKVWFIEANTKPGCKGIDKVNNKESYQKYREAKKWIRGNKRRSKNGKSR